MKNLKRVLSLALATVMVIGMMVVGANAAFNDQADIKYTEAVDMLVGLGVIDGMGNNTFAPNGTLTRAQAAKMVAYVKAGANENTVSYYDGETKFTDVKANHNWAKGSINYCVANGIIAGMTATTYQPDATLTGAQLAKMLLVALGYPATSEKSTETLTGPNWQVNTMRKATEAGLFKGLDSSFAAVKAVTRQEASQIIYNALNANIVKVGSWDMNGNPNYVVDTTTTLLTACFDVVKLTGTVYGNAASGAKGTVVNVTASENTTVAPVGNYTFELATGIDQLGHNVTVLARTDNAGLVRNKETGDVMTYGYVDNASLVKTIVASDNNNKANNTVIKKDLKDAGFNVDTFTITDMYQNYANMNAAPSGYDLDHYDKGNTYVVISNKDNKEVSSIIQVDRYLNKVSDVVVSGTGDNARTTYTFEGTNPVSSAYNTNSTKQINVYDGIAKNDYVIMTKIGSFYDVQKVNTVTASITALNQDANGLKSVVAGGTTYNKSGIKTDNVITGVTAFGTSLKLGDGMLLLDSEGNLIAVAGLTATVNYAYVATINSDVPGTDANGMPTSTTKAVVYFADGTMGAYDVDKANSDANADGTKGDVPSAAGIYNVVRTSDTEVTLTGIKETDKQSGITGVTKGVSKLAAGSDVYTDASTVAFVVDGTYGSPTDPLKVTVYTGTANIPTLAKAPTTAIKKAGATPAVVSVLFFNDTTVASDDVNVYFYDGVYALGQRMDGSKTVNTVTYTVYQNGAATTLTFDKSAAFSTTPGFVKVKADGTDLMAATTAVFDASGITSTNDKDKVTAEVDFNSFFNNTLTVQSGSYKANFQVTADTKVVCLLDNGDVYTLDQLANDNIVDSSKVFVSYTRDANNVLTATAVFVTVVNPHVPA